MSAWARLAMALFSVDVSLVKSPTVEEAAPLIVTRPLKRMMEKETEGLFLNRSTRICTAPCRPGFVGLVHIFVQVAAGVEVVAQAERQEACALAWVILG